MRPNSFGMLLPCLSTQYLFLRKQLQLQLQLLLSISMMTEEASMSESGLFVGASRLLYGLGYWALTFLNQIWAQIYGLGYWALANK